MNQKKILIVDDNRILLKTDSIKLRAHGYHPLTALDGGEAISTVRRERPDLILLDINFPPDVAHGGGVSWDGFQVLAWLRRLEGSRNAPVILMSGADLQRCKNRSLGDSAQGVFRKPLDHEGLLVVTNNLNVATLLYRHPRINVIIAGGPVRRSDGGIKSDAVVLRERRNREGQNTHEGEART